MLKDYITDWQKNIQLKAWTLAKVPALFFVNPHIETLDEKQAVISIPLLRRNKNHMNSMYFGVLAAGADVAGGLLALKKIVDLGIPMAFIFKDFQAHFHKRPEATTFFTCNDGEKVEKLIKKAIATGRRVEETVEVIATCPEKFKDEPVATFTLTISLKKKKDRNKNIVPDVLRPFVPTWLEKKIDLLTLV